MAEPAELYSVVVVGNMNPPIHHPLWYANERVKIISQEEAEAAAANVICTQFLSQFQFSGFQILCMEGRWEIKAQEPAKLKRMVDIAGQTFDVLMHTPVTAFGLNFHFQRPTGLTNVSERLGQLVNGLPLGRKATPNDSSQIMTTTSMNDRVVQEVLSGAPESAGYLRVSFNVHYAIQPQKEFKLFELTPLIRRALEEDYPECLSRAEQLTKKLAATPVE